MSKAKAIRSVRGMGDILPAGQKQFIYQSHSWVWLRERFETWAVSHGYRYIDTPMVEEIELFKRTSGETSDIVNKEMYLVRRSSYGDDTDIGFELCLRPEGSAGISRAVMEHGLARSQAGLKFYYIAPMFRSERPQRGRYRQHTQFGVEVFREPEPSVDVEVIALLEGFYKSIGLADTIVTVNSVGDPQCRPEYREALIAYLEKFKDEMSEDSRSRLYQNPMRCLDSKDEKDQELFAGAPTMLEFLNEECSEHFEEVLHGLDTLGIPYQVDPRLVRGLDYYTKTAFEFKCSTLEGAIQTIGGGGRYDGLVEQIGGPATPAIGFGTSVERILLAMESQGLEAPAPLPPALLVAYMDSGVKYEALRIAEEFRARGVETEFLYKAKNLGKQLNEAAKRDILFVVIVGGEEWGRGEVMLKDFKKRTQVAVPVSEVYAKLDEMWRKEG